MITLTAAADDLRFVVHTSPGEIVAAEVCSFNNVTCGEGAFASLSDRGYLHVQIRNIGYISAEYTVTVLSLSLDTVAITSRLGDKLQQRHIAVARAESFHRCSEHTTPSRISHSNDDSQSKSESDVLGHSSFLSRRLRSSQTGSLTPPLFREKSWTSKTSRSLWAKPNSMSYHRTQHLKMAMALAANPFPFHAPITVQIFSTCSASSCTSAGHGCPFWWQSLSPSSSQAGMPCVLSASTHVVFR